MPPLSRDLIDVFEDPDGSVLAAYWAALPARGEADWAARDHLRVVLRAAIACLLAEGRADIREAELRPAEFEGSG